ncbi:hypothetical protein KJ951_04930 [Patescibacteria group bacterium]|nr:hypothetical protein [Patescibacteria group bacterium]MBU1703721.1 hypothetical protein [Patescibacteria group bacterium]MBU1953620.1 hypothetical protein [Patescibacteria group bacterium]
MVSRQHILLDTSVINNVQAKEADHKLKMVGFLEELIKNENKLYISEFTHYELLGSAAPQKQNEIQ